MRDELSIEWGMLLGFELGFNREEREVTLRMRLFNAEGMKDELCAECSMLLGFDLDLTAKAAKLG